ncbi:MAG: P27 family phage terminase small subunit [Sarcina sp.]
MILNEIDEIPLNQKAYIEYSNGMKYSDIAKKYDTSINTVKSWKTRYKWEREDAHTDAHIDAHNKKSVQEEIKEDLLNQLESNGVYGKHYEDLINDYMSLWDIKNKLIADIEKRGVTVKWSNGKQVSYKKNESIAELNKTNAQMLKILNELGLKPSPKVEDYDDI